MKFNSKIYNPMIELIVNKSYVVQLYIIPAAIIQC